MSNYTIQQNDGRITVCISGRLDTLTASQLDIETQNLLTDAVKQLTLDISQLNYISSSGIRCFVRLFNEAKAAGIEFNITGIQPAIREIFDITRISKIFGL
ncbi:MAG: STAS domain-containing protein [Muribaculaceae bacterium]|nr:STAS domain-containing protein [Muribaculaceae bacterium]